MDEITQSVIHYSSLVAVMLIWVLLACALVAGLEQVIGYFRTKLSKTN